MAIVKMSKFHLFFFSNERERLLDALQHFTYVHFHDLNENNLMTDFNLYNVSDEEKVEVIDEKLRKTTFTINSLRPYDSRKKGLQELKEGLSTCTIRELEQKAKTINLSNIYEKTKKAIDEKEGIKRLIDDLKEEMATLNDWIALHIPLKEISSFTHCRIQIGTIPSKLKDRMKKSLKETERTYYEVIKEDPQYCYIIIVAHESEKSIVQEILLNHSFSEVKLPYVKTPKEEIEQLNKKVNEKEIQLKKNEETLYSLSKSIDDLELLYEYLMLMKTRFLASEKFISTEKINVIEGYIPTKMKTSFEKTVKNVLGEHYYLSVIAADENDPNAPTLLENSTFFRAFESVTEMYALPKYNEIDPTPWFSIFYGIFFGMMIGDAGYGLMMFILSFAALKLFNLTEKQKNFIRFFYYLSFFTIIWGAIFGSFFGDIFALPALINPGEQYNLLLILSIILGGIHVFFALAIHAYVQLKRGNFWNALFDVGFWYMAIGGGIVYILSLFLPSFASYKTIGFIIFLIGSIGILLTGGRANKGFAGKFAGGLYSLYGLTGYIGDFISYTRLMALALASGFIAYAINLMVFMLFDFGIVGIIIGIVIFIVAQTFNLFLSILSGYVHSLRLTYVEFFGKFYEGGGKPFQLFRNATKYINLK